MHSHRLVDHHDIRKWVEAREGQPALRHVVGKTGRLEPRLAIRFRRAEAPLFVPGQDEGMSPCSWTAWMAELDRQHLALEVSDRAGTRIAFVARTTRH